MGVKSVSDVDSHDSPILSVLCCFYDAIEIVPFTPPKYVV